MTDKQKRILRASLELFANEGYAATATSKIAKAAGVSEGLIFRHFGNKQGLLQALMQDIELQLGRLLGPILMHTDAQAVIRQTLELPFTIAEEEHNYWKLQFKLKWEAEYNQAAKMQPLLDKLSWAFAELGYPNPKLEAQLLNQLLDSVSTDILRGNLPNRQEYLQFLIDKYKL